MRALLCGLLLVLLAPPAGCRPSGMTARELLERNVAVVRERELEPFLEQAYKVARMVLSEPALDRDVPGYSREDIIERKSGYRGVFNRQTIRSWLGQHYQPQSDLEVADVFEFRHYDELVRFLGADPEETGVTVPEELAARFPGFETDTWPATRVRFLGRMGVVHFSRALGPVILERERQGRDWSGLRLMEETGVVDRWALGYTTARGRIRGRLMLRARGLWAFWPLAR
ncbi:MAG TPA: hypothetical protein ENN51_00660 [candidate division WOR-3 bacterium]|uniref:Uncharacterized protein n=1 Tax=candidate division WOR-3 bacterium TaxID=2052148 RepID=A0A7V0T4N4_UNCW3|nr:hypothetical protein [candidate division WOR-3 bacterium]